MVLYNITINVDGLITEKWLHWMKTEHIPEIMATGVFSDHKFLKLLNEEPHGETFACQYFADSLDDVLAFQEKHAAFLQSKMHQNFGNSTTDFRTMLEEV